MPLSPTQTNNRTDLPSRQHCWAIMKRHHHNPWRCSAITHTDDGVDLSSEHDCLMIMKRLCHNPWRCAAITHTDNRWSCQTMELIYHPARLLSDHEKASSQPMELRCGGGRMGSSSLMESPRGKTFIASYMALNLEWGFCSSKCGWLNSTACKNRVI